MPRLGLDVCFNIMLPFVENGRKQLKMAELDRTIILNSGATDPRTIKNYKQMMDKLGWIKPISTNIVEIKKTQIKADAAKWEAANVRI